MSKWIKKTEKIEVRLPPETKSEFLETCDRRNETASEAIRGFIERYVERFHVSIADAPLKLVARMPWWSRIGSLGAITSAIVLAVTIPIQANGQSAWKTKFDAADRDKNGIIEPSELSVGFSPELAKTMPAAKVSATSRNITRANWRQFVKMDSNRDAKVTPAEFRKYQDEKTKAILDAFDTNGDRNLDFDELLNPSEGLTRNHLTMMIGFSRLKNSQLERTSVHWSDNACLRAFLDSSQPNVWDMAPVFDRLDRNSNCKVSLVEFARY